MTRLSELTKDEGYFAAMAEIISKEGEILLANRCSNKFAAVKRSA